MSYEIIYSAAKNLDPIKLKQALSITCIDEWKPGVYYFSAASQLALENNKTAVKFLMMHGANINYVAIGAAMGGYLNTVHSLLKAGADVKWVAYAAVIGGHIKFAKKLLTYDDNVITFIAGAIARMGDKDCLIQLMASYPIELQADDKRFICMNAGISGNQELCDALLMHKIFSNFYSMDPVALGAGFGGHKAYCESIIIKCRANIYYTPVMECAAGAAMSGNKVYAERLYGLLKGYPDLLTGLKIMLERAAQAGRKAYAKDIYQRYEKLHQSFWRGLNHDPEESSPYTLQHSLFCGAFAGNHPLYVGEILSHKIEDRIKNPYIEEQKALLTLDQFKFTQHFANRPLSSLSSYHFKFITNLLEELKYSLPQLTRAIETRILKRCLAISRLQYNNISPVSYLMALVLTDKTCHGMLFLLMKLYMAKTVAAPFQNFPSEILLYIFNFVAPVQLETEDLKDLAFIVSRAYLGAQLSFYQSKDNVTYKERAKSFCEAIQSTKSKDELMLHVDQQVEILQGNNPYWFFQRDKTYKKDNTSTKIDGYHHILGFWKREMTGEAVEFEPNKRRTVRFIQK